MRFLNKQLLKGSLVLLITINLFNLFNLIFNLSMARSLSIENYGILSVLLNLIIIFAIFSESIQTIISKYSTLQITKGSLKTIALKSFKKATRLSLLSFIIFLIFGILVSYYLKISYFLILFTGFAIFGSFYLPITRGILQGRKNFGLLGSSFVIEGFSKLIISFFLVYYGFTVFGALSGVLIGLLISFVFTIFALKSIFNSKVEKAELNEIYSYSWPVFFTTLSIVLFLSLDIILARLFFSASSAGEYALASTLTKILFIGTQPISKALFPISSEKKLNSLSRSAFVNSLVILFGIILVFLSLTFFFPDLIIKLYSGSSFSIASSILFYLSISAGFLSITNLVLLYALSRNNYSITKYSLIFVIIQVIILTIFNDTLLSYSIGLIISSVMFLIGVLLMFLYGLKSK